MDVRDSILQAGAMLLKEQGIAALTQPRVARAAQVKQSHLTYYFPKRGDLLLGIAEHTIDQVMAELAARLESGPDPAAFAETVARALVAGVPPRVMIGLIVAADADPALRPPLRKLIAHVRARIRGLLGKAGAASGEDAALLFHASMVGLAILHHARRTPASATEVRRGIAGMVELLAAKPARGARAAVQ